MHNQWILAVSSPNAPAVPPPVTGESVQKESTTTAITAADANSAGKQAPPPANPWMQYGLLAVMFVLLYFIMFRGPRKRQAEQKNMINSLKKNDRVQTIGGILGTVIEVKENEVTVKVDESNNTKIRIVPAAVSRVFTDEKS